MPLTRIERQAADASPKSPTLPVEFVSEQAAIAAACASLEGAPWIAVDTEFIGERTYLPRVELIQLASPTRAVLIDARGIQDAAPLARLMHDAATTKLFHAASQDLEILRRLTGAVPSPVFDTQLAAAFLGHGLQISLANLAGAILDVELDGRQTTSDWGARPFTEAQLRYAANDVAHLGELHARLRAQLADRGRLAWYTEEQEARLAEAAAPSDVPDEEQWRRVKNSTGLKPRELAFLRELAAWRERTARRIDTPRRVLLPDEALVELAMHQPANREALSRLRRVPTGNAMRHSDDILAVLQSAARLTKDQWPHRVVCERRPPPAPGVLEIALAVMRLESERNGVAPSLVATTDELTTVVTTAPAVRPTLDVGLLRGWRREVAGARILDLLDGRILLRVTPSGIEEVLPGPPAQS